MKHFPLCFLFFFFMLSLTLSAQEITNIYFEQIGKQIHIYYDLFGKGPFEVKVYCSTDNGQTWGQSLQKVAGAIGENQKPGNNKEIVWDVLAEREKLTGEIQFRIEARPSNTGIFADTRDGQTYKWVKIGNQVWMAENLNYKEKSGSWCYSKKVYNCNDYGRLYNWRTALLACPKGWHLPDDSEWKILIDYLGGGEIAGGKLKEISTSHWKNPNKGASDMYKFNARPAGYRYPSGLFNGKGSIGKWWSETDYSSDEVWYFSISYISSLMNVNTDDKDYGFSVRCVKDY